MPLSFASGRLLASQRIAYFHDGFHCTANLAARTPRPGEDQGPTSLLPPGHDGRHLIPEQLGPSSTGSNYTHVDGLSGLFGLAREPIRGLDT